MDSKDGAHLRGLIENYGVWHRRWRALAVVPARSCNVSSGVVGRRYMWELAAELTGVIKRCCNSEIFIIFQRVILQRARHLIASRAIGSRINCRLDA